MTKREFIETLREVLSYELPERLVKKNTDYYSGYFDEQMKLGKRAEEICEELGDPRLIARSCIEVEKAGEDGIPCSGDEPDFSEEIFGNSAGPMDGSVRDEQDTSEESGPRKSFSINGREFGCGGCLLGMLILVGIMSVISAFFTTLFTAGGSSIITVILLIILAALIIEYFRRR